MGQAPRDLYLIEPRKAAPQTVSLEAQRSAADFVHVAVNHNLALADRKAGILLTLVSAGLLFLLERHGLSPIYDWASARAVIWFFMMLSLALSAATAFRAILPRLIRSHNGLFFWEVIGSYSRASRWIADLQCRSEADLTDARLRHCHALARICTKKFRLLRLSMTAAVGGIVAAALFIVV